MKSGKGSLWGLLLAAMLCVGASLAQDIPSGGAARYGVAQAAGDLGLTTFPANLERAGLIDTLDNQGVLLFGSGSFAVFAPTDEAFASAEDIDVSSLAENQTELRRKLSYHVVWNDAIFENISEVSTLQTLEGENVSIDSTSGLKVNGANVTAVKKYDNGTLYVIDRLLVPRGKGSLDVTDEASRLGAGKFASAIRSEGLADTLNGQGPMGIEALKEGPYTIFAPSDAAFGSAKATLDSISKKDAGTRTLLSYHIIDAKSLSNLTEAGSIKTLGGDSLAVDLSAGFVGGARVIKSGRYENGIIYVIDQVLVPIRLAM